MAPFDDDYKEPEKKPKQKLTNENSIFKNVQSSEDFEQKVKLAEQQRQKYKAEIQASIIKFKKVLEDKTLQENKNPISSQIDSDVVRELTGLAELINNDNSEKEGMGTFLLCTVLMKFMIMYRDRFNALEYKLQSLENKLNDFPNKIEERLSRLKKE